MVLESTIFWTCWWEVTMSSTHRRQRHKYLMPQRTTKSSRIVITTPVTHFSTSWETLAVRATLVLERSQESSIMKLMNSMYPKILRIRDASYNELCAYTRRSEYNTPFRYFEGSLYAGLQGTTILSSLVCRNRLLIDTCPTIICPRGLLGR